MARIPLLLLLLGALVSLVTASAPTFCKCTCLKNSTIIPLGPQRGGADPPSNTNPPPSQDGDSSDSEDSNRDENSPSPANPGQSSISSLPNAMLEKRASSSSCSQCTRAFCKNYNLPICKEVDEKDILTMCFQRDSRKDQIIVWGFILGTAGLLGWAGAQRLYEFREGAKASGLRMGGLGIGGRGGGGRSPGPQRAGSGMESGLDSLRSPRDEAARGNYQPVGGEVEGRSGDG